MPKRVRNASIASCVCAACAVFPLLASGAAPDRHKGQAISAATSDADLAKATQFLKVLLAGDERSLQPYGPGFFKGGRLDRATWDSLYTPNVARKKRSVNQIAAEGDLQIVLRRQENGIITVIYVPKKFMSRLKDRAFLADDWMNKYFACEFDTTKPQWTLYYNFCFAETGGPYEAGYGL